MDAQPGPLDATPAPTVGSLWSDVSGLALADELLEKWQGEWDGSFAPLFRDYAY